MFEYFLYLKFMGQLIEILIPGKAKGEVALGNLPL